MNNFIPKWLAYALGAVLLVFVVLLVVEKGDKLINDIRGKKPNNTISISAEGKVPATPDMATVTLGVISQGSSATAVKNENNDKVNKITEYVKSLGVDVKDVTTSQFYFYPQQNYNNGKSEIVGYQGNQTITVKIYGIDKSQDQLNKLLDGSINSGANEIQNVSFSFKDPDDLRQQARKAAIEKAKQKAQELANEAGIKLGKVISISETGSSYGIAVPYAADSMAYGKGGGGSIAPSVQPGTQDITESMTVIFEVK